MTVNYDIPGELHLTELRAARERVAAYVVETPSIPWHSGKLLSMLPAGTEVWTKLELFQQAGTFKPRGAMNVMLHLDEAARARGVTAVSAGNHAIAVAYCASRLGIDAQVFMPKTASPYRIAKAEKLGAKVVLCDTQTEMFERAEALQREQGRTFIHPFEGPRTLQGSAGVGLEIAAQMPDLDAMIIPIGGGGLAGGVAAALRQLRPGTAIYGVEPEGANTMTMSIAQGGTVQREQVSSIADSLCPPRTEPFSFSVCNALLDDIVLVDDAALRRAMAMLLSDLHLVVEPAAAATLAALCGPLRDRLAGQRVGTLCCGTNIAFDDYMTLMADELNSSL
jgi:threonine dehydratase